VFNTHKSDLLVQHIVIEILLYLKKPALYTHTHTHTHTHT